MRQEIERKFLVTGEYGSTVSHSFKIIQGFILADPRRSVRVRIEEKRGFVNIKGMMNETGISRYEWEKEIPLDEAEELMQLCEPGIIEKTRHLVNAGKHLFEVDEFHGKNEGLVVAEIELKTEDEEFEKPEWLGKEITGDLRYYNAMLSKHPFSGWRSH
jgi:adenylate cyclase